MNESFMKENFGFSEIVVYVVIDYKYDSQKKNKNFMQYSIIKLVLL